MKTSWDKIVESFQKLFVAQYPQFPLRISESPDDQLVLCVEVFAVPPDKVAEIKTFIRQNRGQIVCGGDYLLLPMVRDLEVTARYYSEYLTAEPFEKEARLFV